MAKLPLVVCRKRGMSKEFPLGAGWIVSSELGSEAAVCLCACTWSWVPLSSMLLFILLFLQFNKCRNYTYPEGRDSLLQDCRTYMRAKKRIRVWLHRGPLHPLGHSGLLLSGLEARQPFGSFLGMNSPVQVMLFLRKLECLALMPWICSAANLTNLTNLVICPVCHSSYSTEYYQE